MATAKEYWNGTKQAVLTPDDVTAPKLRKEPKFGLAVTTCNKAFQMFYEARQLISRISDTPASN